MKRLANRQTRRGLAMIELALIMVFAIGLLPVVLQLGWVFWHHIALQKMTYDSARYMASLTPVEMNDPAQVAQAKQLVYQMVGDAARGAHLQAIPGPYQISILCGSIDCGGATQLPATVQVQVQVEVGAGDLAGASGAWLAPLGNITLRTGVTLRYAN
jgi:Flp pilus assembly protein TadG